jgi:hypothetical protein
MHATTVNATAGAAHSCGARSKHITLMDVHRLSTRDHVIIWCLQEDRTAGAKRVKRGRAPRAIILAPTRELANQVWGSEGGVNDVML